MVKNAMWSLNQKSKKAVYLLYELGWFHFLNENWETALRIFKHIAQQAFSESFFQNQISEAHSQMSNLPKDMRVNLSNCQPDIFDQTPEKEAILPHLPQLSLKIAACYFRLEKEDQAMKWLLATPLIQKKYSNFKSKVEEDFSKLAQKFALRKSKVLLVYELYYLMRYLPKLPDENLKTIATFVDEYKNELPLTIQQLKTFLNTNNKTSPYLIEYFSSTLISLICYCLLGDTDFAVHIYESSKTYMSLIPEDYQYLVPHIEYWVGRALIAEEKHKEAKALLKNALKHKKHEFNITNKIKKVLTECEG